MSEKEPQKDDRVELMPHMDLWVRGAKFGKVEKVVILGGFTKYKIKLDMLGASILFSRNQFRIID